MTSNSAPSALPSREQLMKAIGELDTETLREKLASGDLTDMAKSVATEELGRRQREGDIFTESTSTHEASSERSFLKHPFGWSYTRWAMVLAGSFLIIISFGLTAKSKDEQWFLFGVSLIQAFVLASIIRVVVALFSSSRLSLLGKFLVLGVLGFILLGLTLCSSMLQTGWRGG